MFEKEKWMRILEGNLDAIQYRIEEVKSDLKNVKSINDVEKLTKAMDNVFSCLERIKSIDEK